LVPGDELAGRDVAGPDPQSAPGDGAASPVHAAQPPAGAPDRLARLRAAAAALARSGSARLWTGIFAASLAAFLIRFLVPVPVAQADNRDGPRLLCGLGLSPVISGHPRFFRYSYFTYVHSPACAGRLPYPSSQLVPLVLARVLTPVFGLPGTLNMIALGVLMCLLASVGIASLALGLRIRLWARLLVAAVVWLIVADSAFFDVFGGPFSEPAALVGLVLVAAGVLYLGRGWQQTVTGLALAGCGGFLAILSKEQYLIWAAPVCLTLALAGSGPGSRRGLRRFRTRQARAALLVAAVLAVLTAGYVGWDFSSHYAKRLHNIQAVDMIFTEIVTNRATAPGQLRDLGLPVSWAKYAGHWYWDRGSVRTDPLLHRYEGRLNDGTITGYLLTHPGSIVSIGQQTARLAQLLRVTQLGDYPPGTGHRPGAVESRVGVLTWLMRKLPAGLGLLWYLPVWGLLTAIALLAHRWGRRRAWNRDGAVLVFCMIGCAVTAFIPPTYFAGISTTRHMVGMNLATALAAPIAVGLAVSLVRQQLARRRQPRPGTSSLPPALARTTS
jgi:hypothetical protein